MKLLEILQKELKEFPEGMLYAVQDDDGEVKFGKHSQSTLFWEWGVWYRKHKGENFLIIPGLELAEDRDSAIVTKDMWGNDRVKQIIVNVSGLSEEEKQCVNEALAKITGFVKSTSNLVAAKWMYAPSSYTDGVITSSSGNEPNENKEPTHTPKQVLEMAGMAEKRKVRKDFDPRKSICVDVSNCTKVEKRKVQQAFFDVGIGWFSGSIGRESEAASFRYLDAVLYTNSTPEGTCSEHLMFGKLPRADSISPQQFLSMVYEEEQQGHVHADLMAQYAEDAKTTDKPWELWQIKAGSSDWINMSGLGPAWDPLLQFRRKPKTHTVHGVEIPDLRFVPKRGEKYYLVEPTEPEFTRDYFATGGRYDTVWTERGLCYENTEEGKQAAILHAKAWLGIA